MSTRYQQYLRSPEWAAIRAIVMARAGGICEGCKKRPAEQVHHLTYARVYMEAESDLVALCPTCHAKRHGLLPKKPRRKKTPKARDSEAYPFVCPWCGKRFKSHYDRRSHVKAKHPG